MYYYCTGVYLDENFCEQTCRKRESCKYYDVDIYTKYKHIWHQMDFLVCFNPCSYFTQKENPGVFRRVREEKKDKVF